MARVRGVLVAARARFTAQAPDAWIATGTVQGWIAMGRRLAHSTAWDPRRTVATASLAYPDELITLGGVETFDGLRGTRSDGSTWMISRTLLIDQDSPTAW